MEILTTGEKIKRARIQKEMTLKELCGKEISVSKMSTIENGKVQAEEWLLKLVAQRLDVDIEYLKKDIIQEITDELKHLEERKDSRTYEDEIKELIDIANTNELYKQAFLARIQLIDHYIYKNKLDLLSLEVSNLYKTLVRVVNPETMHLYILSMGKYLVATREFHNASVFLQNLMDNFDSLPESISGDERLKIPYMLMQCYVYTHQYEKAERYYKDVRELMETTASDEIKGEIHMMFYSLKASKGDDEDLEEDYRLINSYLRNHPENLARAKFMIAMIKIEKGMKEEGYRELEEAAYIFPKDRLGENTEILMSAMGVFARHRLYEEADKYIDLLVNSAIENGDTDHMQKAYFYKGMLLGKKGKYDQAETYMSVSLDLLSKSGKSKELFQRYRDLGKIYYAMGNKQEAVKYLAMSFQ